MFIHIYIYIGSIADKKFKEMNELLWIPYKDLKSSKVNMFFSVVLKIKSLQKWFQSKMISGMFLFMEVCIHLYVYIYTDVRMHMYVYLYICKSMKMRICIYI
jgi:hypothetical protein